jgi:hypothetical protein
MSATIPSLEKTQRGTCNVSCELIEAADGQLILDVKLLVCRHRVTIGVYVCEEVLRA